MTRARLSVTDPLGTRTLSIEQPSFTIGRRAGHHLALSAGDASRDHAEITWTGQAYVLRDLQSRCGTFVNGTRVGERRLAHGDRLRFGSGDIEAVFLLDEGVSPIESSAAAAAFDFRRMAALLETMRSLGSGRLVDEVLTIVLDAAIDATGAERGFIMLADAAGQLELRAARAEGHVSPSDQGFATSRKIPEEVFASGESRLLADLLDGDLAALHDGTIAAGIRHVLCVPLTLARYVETAAAPLEPRRVGVLYLDSRERGALLSSTAVTALEMLAREAVVAIEQARLYREAEAKAKLDRELAVAARIQQALLPPSRREGPHFEALGFSVACRSIGGDFFDYLDEPGGAFGFALGDVSGKGPPAALLTAMLQGMLAAHAGSAGPAETLRRINEGLLRRAVSAKYATAFYAVLAPDGRLTSCNAGHNPPFLVAPDGLRRLETGGTVVGLLPDARYEEETITLQPGTLIVVFSDGISEAFNAAGEEFGDARILAVLEQGDRPLEVLMAALLESVRTFCVGTEPGDDQTVVMVRYRGPATAR
ncbi:MAG TPA: SpoIIE family protein phosphatase [Vicinamibacterales bacterium]|jgi:serine phosphatase RsbU (regulator of sigma subunit)